MRPFIWINQERRETPKTDKSLNHVNQRIVKNLTKSVAFAQELPSLTWSANHLII